MAGRAAFWWFLRGQANDGSDRVRNPYKKVRQKIFTYRGWYLSVMATQEREGVLEGLHIDVVRLHETWMELLFPRQRGTEHSVLGKWKPSTRGEWLKYRAWAALGVPLVAVLYPLLLLGFATRFYSRRFDSAATRVGLLGVVLVAAVVWGSLTVVTYVRFPDLGGVLAVLAASVVAVVSSGFAYGFKRLDGRPVTVLLGYPFATTAIFLPPVVAAFYSPAVGEVVFSGSTTLAALLLDNILWVGDLNTYLRHQFDLNGAAFLMMWFAIAIPVGWFLGLVVTLADLVRPETEEDPDEKRAQTNT